jgi:hypothetical protein
MKKYFIFIFILFYVIPAYSISSFAANYDLFVKTNLGAIKVGSAEYELILTENVYVFRNYAKTDKLLKAIYDYSINEISIGQINSNKFIGEYYKIIENQGDFISDQYEININELLLNIFNKSQIETLSDSNLIIKAIDSGNFKKIKFSDNQTKDTSIPSYKKELKNRLELIEALLEIDSNSSDIVDALSLYLYIARDIKKSPNEKVLTYQLVDKKGVSKRKFTINGFEKISINGNEIETIMIECSELGLTINVAENYDFMPVYIRKTNGKTKFRLILTDFIQI